MYSVEKTKGQNFFRQFDYILFSAVLLLSMIGMLVVRSATSSMSNGSRIMMMQIVGMVLGVVLALIVGAFDYKDFKSLGFIFYMISTVLLVVVIFRGTGKQYGSSSWLDIGGVLSLQPADLAKITFVIVAAVFLERIKEAQEKIKSNIVKLFIYSAIPIGLILMQPDFGMAIVFVFMFLVMIFIGGLPMRYIAGAAAGLAALAPVVWFFGLNDKRRSRIFVFLNPESDPLGAGYNVLQSKMTIGSGQLGGKGLFQGIQRVPVQESDFIFTVVGEELGFIGTVSVIALVFIILLRCIYIAKNSRDPYGSFVVIGLTGMFAFHAFENIGMTIGLLPVTGLPLPFVSAGGTAMVTNYIAIGVILSVSMRRRKTIFNSSQ